MCALATSYRNPTGHCHRYCRHRRNNEDIKQHNARQLYADAKRLDRSRLVNTADGVWADVTRPQPNPTDFASRGFELRQIPLGDPPCRIADPPYVPTPPVNNRWPPS